MGRNAEKVSRVMSAENHSYRLRPNKYVDRELFAEFVSLLVTDADPDNYVYISMGGTHLSDHLAIYRRAGLRKLYSFDQDEAVVNRQKFNAPFDGVACRVHFSEELPVLLGGILSEFEAHQVVVWLDYTAINRQQQLTEIQELAPRLTAGDVVKVTMNANFEGINQLRDKLSPTEKALPIGKQNAILLKREFGAYMPGSITDIDSGHMVEVLAKCIERAYVLGMEESSEDKMFSPVLLTKYKDTTQMLTATVMVTDRNGTPHLPKGWTYAPSNWDQVEIIRVSELSTRERLALDQQMHKEYEDIQDFLGFHLDEPTIKAYSRFHRFYPAFQTVIE